MSPAFFQLGESMSETTTMVSSVNGIEIQMPKVIDNSRDSIHDGQTQQEKLNARFTGRNGTEGGKLFLTPSDHAAMTQEEQGISLRASGATATFSVPSSSTMEFDADRKKREQRERLAAARDAKAAKRAPDLGTA
jgi:hypothetical protein